MYQKNSIPPYYLEKIKTNSSTGKKFIEFEISNYWHLYKLQISILNVCIGILRLKDENMLVAIRIEDINYLLEMQRELLDYAPFEFLDRSLDIN
jgi:hypothetical protein